MCRKGLIICILGGFIKAKIKIRALIFLINDTTGRLLRPHLRHFGIFRYSISFSRAFLYPSLHLAAEDFHAIAEHG
jgi:hypothetical protein